MQTPAVHRRSRHCGWQHRNPRRPYLIQNNFLEASGEGVLFGGGPATKKPRRHRNHRQSFLEALAMDAGKHAIRRRPDGKPFIVKNHFELKNAVRVLFEANLLENVWGGFTQAGHAIVMSLRINTRNRARMFVRCARLPM